MPGVTMQEDESIQLPDGRRLGFADYGDPAGRPVFYFHGWPSSRYQGRYLDPLARARGLRVISPDRPGIGLSDPKPSRHFSDWPADVAALADSLALKRFGVVGVSGGCPYTLATGTLLPDRVTRAAVLCGAPPVTGEDYAEMHWIYRTLARAKPIRRAALPGILKLSRWMIQRGAARPPMSWLLNSIAPADREALKTLGGWDAIMRSYLEAIRNGPSPVLTEGELYLKPWDFQPEEIPVPVRFWHGTADANLPCGKTRQLADRIASAEGRWIDGEGHYSLPLRYAPEALDWLAEASA